MRKRIRVAAVVGFSMLLLILPGLALLYWAVRQEPEFYREAAAVDSASQKEASDQLLRRAAALRNDVEKPGEWEALFTAEEINGWLAVDLVQNHPDLLPESFHDPRTGIGPDGVDVAWRVDRAGLKSVVTLSVEPYLVEPNVMALRIRGVHAGLVPMPLGKVVETITKAAEKMDLRVEWQQAEGDPIAIIQLPANDANGKRVEVDTLKLGEGEVYLSGTTRKE